MAAWHAEVRGLNVWSFVTNARACIAQELRQALAGRCQHHGQPSSGWQMRFQLLSGWWYLCIANTGQAAVQARGYGWRSGCVGVDIQQHSAAHVVGRGITVARRLGKLGRVPIVLPVAPAPNGP